MVINQAPPPGLNVGQVTTQRRPDKSYEHYWMIEVVAASPPNSLVIAVTGANVTEFTINPLTMGTVQHGDWVKGNVRYMRVQAPSGRFQIVVNTTDATPPIKVDYGFNQ